MPGSLENLRVSLVCWADRFRLFESPGTEKAMSHSAPGAQKELQWVKRVGNVSASSKLPFRWHLPILHGGLAVSFL